MNDQKVQRPRQDNLDMCQREKQLWNNSVGTTLMLYTTMGQLGRQRFTSVLEQLVKTALYVPILPEVTDIAVTLVWPSHSVHIY